LSLRAQHQLIKSSDFRSDDQLGTRCNLMNNLPVGLIAGSAIEAGHVSQHITGALLVGVDLGPNPSVIGSLATILWRTALRREGIVVSAWHFQKPGFMVILPARATSMAFSLGSFILPFVTGFDRARFSRCW
jgi:Na+/H+ antiporter NhaD/arsenite permease-like protein